MLEKIHSNDWANGVGLKNKKPPWVRRLFITNYNPMNISDLRKTILPER